MACLAALCSAAEPITPGQAREHAGQWVTVEGVVAEVVVSRRANVFLNFERAYPANDFAAVVLVHRGGAALVAEGAAWLRELRGRRVRVSGEIVLHQGRAQIPLTDRAQLRVEVPMNADPQPEL